MLDIIAEARENEAIESLFSDPMHQIHNSEVGKAWQAIGAAGTKIIPSNTGRRRLKVYSRN